MEMVFRKRGFKPMGVDAHRQANAKHAAHMQQNRASLPKASRGGAGGAGSDAGTLAHHPGSTRMDCPARGGGVGVQDGSVAANLTHLSSHPVQPIRLTMRPI